MALIAARGDDMWGANEFTQSILRWKRGTSVTVEELKLPVVLRRGGRCQGQKNMSRHSDSHSHRSAAQSDAEWRHADCAAAGFRQEWPSRVCNSTLQNRSQEMHLDITLTKTS